MRKKWALPSDDELIKHIETYHHATIDERLERYKFIWQEFGEPSGGLLLFGGHQAALALDEIKLCYIEGYYLAVVLLAQIFIESSLGGSYIVTGNEVMATKGFKKLANRALVDNLINDELATKFEELRKMRNPYVHPRAGAGEGTIMGRMVEKFKNGQVYESITDFAKDDAERAIQIVVDFLRYSTDNDENSDAGFVES